MEGIRGSRKPSPKEWKVFLSRYSLGWGTLLLLGGALCFFACNWSVIPGLIKLLLLDGAILIAIWKSWRAGLRRLEGQIALGAAAFLVGPLLGVYGQTYQTGADSYVVFTLWALLVAPWVWAARLPSLAAGYLVMLDLALGLSCSQLYSTLYAFPAVWFLNGFCWIAWGRRRVEWLDEEWLGQLLATSVLLSTIPVLGCLASLGWAGWAAIGLLLALLRPNHAMWLQVSGFPLALLFVNRYLCLMSVAAAWIVGGGTGALFVLVLIAPVILTWHSQQYQQRVGESVPWYSRGLLLIAEALVALMAVYWQGWMGWIVLPPSCLILGSQNGLYFDAPVTLVVMSLLAYCGSFRLARGKVFARAASVLSLLGLAVALAVPPVVWWGTFCVTSLPPLWSFAMIILLCELWVLMSYPGTGRRFLAVLLIGLALAAWLGLDAAMIGLSGLAAWLWLGGAAFVEGWRPGLSQPLAHGSAAGTLMLAIGSSGWNSGGVASIGLCLGLFCLAGRVLRELELTLPAALRIPLAGASILFALAVSLAPGIPALLGLFVLAFYRRDEELAATAMALSGIFGFLYYFCPAITLLEKATVLSATGALLLLTRQWLLAT